MKAPDSRVLKNVCKADHIWLKSIQTRQRAGTMMDWARIVATLTAAALLAPIAMAQSDRKCADAEFDSHSVLLDEVGPFAGASLKATFARSGGANCRLIAFYRLEAKPPAASTQAGQRKLRQEYAGKTAPPFFAARYVDDKRNAPFAERWTDQDRCPALVPALEKLEPILAPKLTGEGPYRDMSTGITDQPDMRFWLAGQIYPQANPDYTMDLTLDGGAGGPFGAWLDETFKALDACWSTDPPVIK